MMNNSVINCQNHSDKWQRTTEYLLSMMYLYLRLVKNNKSWLNNEDSVKLLVNYYYYSFFVIFCNTNDADSLRINIDR